MITNLLLKRMLLLWVFAFSTTLWGQTTVTHTFTATSGAIDPNISYTTEKNNATTAPAINGLELRLYFGSGNGGSVTLLPKNNATITDVKITSTTGYTPTVKYNVDGSDDATAVLSGTQYTIASVMASSSLKIRNANATNTQLRITSIEITYTLPVTGPEVTVNQSNLNGFTYVEGSGPSAEQSFSVGGSNLTADITVTAPTNFEVSTVSGTDFGSEVTLPLTGGTVYTRMIAGLLEGNYGGNIELTSGATNVNVAVSGDVTAVPLGTPLAIAATNITSDSFIANWEAVTGADSYELDVYTLTGSPATTITETFTNIGGGTKTSYLKRTWTGEGGVNWTAYKARTDNEIVKGNETVTLQNSLGAYLESGIINGGLSKISFDVQQFFGGTGGILTIKVLTGPSFGTVTIIGTKEYDTTASTYDSGVISGITGDYKIVIENNESARPAIDNLSFTSLATSTKTFVSGYENLDVSNVNSKEVTGLTAETTYKYVVRAISGATTSANSNEIAVTTTPVPAVTWDGTTWSNITGPTNTTHAVINGDYAGNSFEAKSLTINAGKTLTINSSVTTGDLTNNGTIIVNDNASLVQTVGGQYYGTGTFTVNRTSKSAKDKYAFWSSPLDGQNMFNIYPGNPPAFVMTYNTTNNLYTTLVNPAVAERGVGYSIKTSVASPAVTFSGTIPNNGSFSTDLTLSGSNYNLVGNPYPSNLNLPEFYTLNSDNIESTLWFWDNSSNSVTTQSGTTTTNFGYAIYNLPGKTWLAAPTAATPVDDFAKIGQGFIVKAKSTSLLFDNSLRATNTGVNFNKSSSANEGKYWLKLSTPYNSNVTQAITYQQGASNNYDGYDSKALGLGSDAFYSFAGTEKVVIQGKAPFNADDVVVLGNKHFENGNFKIELTDKEGIFAEGQAIYLNDKLLGTETNLQEGAYLFSSNAGEFSDRFEVVYSKTVLGTDSSAKSTLAVYRNGDDFVIDSPSKISSIEVYDASGKAVKMLKSSGNKEIVSNLSRGVYILKITTATETVSKKVIK